MSTPAATRDVIATSRAFIRNAPTHDVLFVSSGRFRNMVVLSAIAAALLAPTLMPYSLWLVPGMALSMFVVWHTTYACRRVPWIPGLIAAMACVQWIVAPWLAYSLQNTLAIPRMPLPPETYFAYFVPGAFALVAGLYTPLLGFRRLRTSVDAPVRAEMALRTVADVMLFGGFVVRVFLTARAPGSVRYILTLLDHLMYVGAFTRIMLGAPGWRWRVGLVLGAEFALNAIDAQFASALIWTLLTACVVVYRHRLRARSAIALALAGVALLFAINGFKGGFRDTIRSEGIDDAERPGAVASGVTSFALRPSRLLSAQNLAGNISRLNEGWIAGRVLIWVPYREPYAEGETLRKAVVATVVPRLLDPGKLVAGGRDNVPRFTGLQLIRNTSMNLSIPGEMYANYGYWGGLLGTFGLALVLGYVFRLFVRWAQTSPLMYAWAPYLLYGAVSAEMGLYEVIGTLGKAAMVASLVIFATPAWWAQLSKRARSRTRLVEADAPGVA